MSLLVVFDFDHTLVEGNTDVEVQKLSEIPPEISEKSKKMGWTEFMQEIFNHLHQQKVTEEQIKAIIGEMAFSKGAKEMLITLKTDLKAEIIIISDANSYFIETLLEVGNLTELITETFTHPAEFDSSGKLVIRRLNPEIECSKGPGRLCKGHILKNYIRNNRKFDLIGYVGDGINDFCPMTELPEDSGTAFVKIGFGLDRFLKKEPSKLAEIKADIHFWESDDIAMVSRVLSEKVKNFEAKNKNSTS